jgi:formylglycine-generating enzyme required for sulfatase activity
LDDGNVSPTDVNLECDLGYATWTTSAGSSESLPINCVNWWESYGFCIWDGGFLPSEAEWEYAAAGGSEQREYPWGATDPATSSQYAIFGCYYPNGSGACTGLANVAPVGTPTQGAGAWTQLDLAGDMLEWNLDGYASGYADPCRDCALLAAASDRVVRGSGFGPGASYLRPPQRNHINPAARDYSLGLRCARTL